MTIPDACRTLQNLYADNGNQWKDILGWESKTEFSSKNGQKSYLVKLSIFFYKSGSIRIKLTFPWTDRLVRIESNGTDR